MAQARLVAAPLLAAVLAICGIPFAQAAHGPTGGPLVRAAAAQPSESDFRQLLSDQERLFRVGDRVLADNLWLCGASVRRSSGLGVANSRSYGEAHRPAATAVLGADDRLRIVHLADGFPAAAAGLRPGDILLAVNGRPAPRGAAAVRDWEAALDRPLPSGAMTVVAVQRRGGVHVVQMAPMLICDYPVVLAEDERVYAYADRDAIRVSRGLIRATPDDRALALAIAHELLHRLAEDAPSKEAGLGLDRATPFAGVPPD